MRDLKSGIGSVNGDKIFEHLVYISQNKSGSAIASHVVLLWCQED